MGLLILVTLGALLGWLASIVTSENEFPGIVANGTLGIAGALVGGALASQSSLLDGISSEAVLVALATSAIMLALSRLWHTQASAEDRQSGSRSSSDRSSR